MTDPTKKQPDVPQREDDNAKAEPGPEGRNGPPPNVLRDKGAEPAEQQREKVRDDKR